jgi:hypothetical protein
MKEAGRKKDEGRMRINAFLLMATGHKQWPKPIISGAEMALHPKGIEFFRTKKEEAKSKINCG